MTMTDILTPSELQALATVAMTGDLATASQVEKRLLRLGYIRITSGIVSITKDGRLRLANERTVGVKLTNVENAR